MPLATAMWFLRQLLVPLAWMHTLDVPVVHGDLKPDNVLLTPSGDVVLTDFGLAAHLPLRSLGGAISYQAPETLLQHGADSRADIMSSGMGVAVKRGAPKPDIGTVEAFKQTLLKAKSVTYLKEGASTIHLRKLFVQLGVADAIKAKAVETDGEMVSELVAEGKVELGLIVVPNIMSVPGAELVGPLPAAINSIVMFTAGVSASSPNQQAARELIKLLKSPGAKPVIQAKGNDPA